MGVTRRDGDERESEVETESLQCPVDGVEAG